MAIYSEEYLKEYDVFERSFSTKNNPDAKKDRDGLARRMRQQGWEIKTKKATFPDFGNSTIYVIEGRKKKPLPPPVDGREWEPLNRDLIRGDILKILLDCEHPENGWIYAFCSGSGFGCSRNSLGHAIFVVESVSLDAIENYTAGVEDGTIDTNDDKTPDGLVKCRWESNWGIYVKKSGERS